MGALVRRLVLTGVGIVLLPALFLVLLIFGPFAWVLLGTSMILVSTAVRYLREGSSDADFETVECPGCGATIAAALDRCPNCDEQLFPPEDDDA
ncbi:hypothetical protein [Halegenticoccus soli]|uniref:hypothetical protein n=1 Tax=Halegenticoccus soli TaxID=1985678 RepID=UPI000C6DE561|nr:hypothetical protein [Halegenticoccus soli]